MPVQRVEGCGVMVGASADLRPLPLASQEAASLDGSPTPALPRGRVGERLSGLTARLPRGQGERQLPWLVLVLGLLLTALVCDQNRRLGQQAHARIELALLDDVADAIQAKIQQDIDIVTGAAALFNASGAVSREEFRRYTTTISREEHRLNGIQGVGFSRLLSAPERRPLEAQVRAEGFADFRIRPEGERPLLSTIQYLEPFNLRNQRAFGFDMYSEPVRREAMDRAALTGMPALSGMVRLLQETGTDVQAGVLVYVPVYAPGLGTLPLTSEAYPGRLLGWAYSPVRVGDLVQAALRTVNNPDLQGSAVLVYDGIRTDGPALMVDTQALHGTPRLTHPQFQRIRAAGRSWLVGIQLTRAQIGPSGITPGFWILALAGGLSAVIAALITEQQVARHGRTLAALRLAEQARNDQALAAVVFEASPQAIVVSDPQGRVISANQSFARITGYSGSEILGRPLSLLKSGRHESAFYADLWATVRERGFWQGEIWNRLRNGEIRRHELSITAVRNPQLEVIHYVGMLQDVSERHQQQEIIRQRALHDPLTGLANRTLLLELTDRALAQAEQQSCRVALLFLDLDGFKPINDRHGHALGDQVLQVVASKLLGVVRASDTLARLGGDEFVVLVPRLAGAPEELTTTLAARLAAAIATVQEQIAEPLALSVSIGIAWTPEHGVTTGQLIAAADAAMYRAKRGGEARVQIARAGETMTVVEGPWPQAAEAGV